MNYQLAQLNIARFQLPKAHPANADFVDNLDHVNAIAESQPGFVWRLVGEGNNALDVQAFDDPHLVVNLSVWSGLEALRAFVYRNEEHLAIMRRRQEWFGKADSRLVLWWVAAGHLPSLEEAKHKLHSLQQRGAAPEAFTFKTLYPTPVAK